MLQYQHGFQTHEPEAGVEGVEATGDGDAEVQVGVEVRLQEVEQHVIHGGGLSVEGVVEGVRVPPQAQRLPYHLQELARLSLQLQDVERVQLLAHKRLRRRAQLRSDRVDQEGLEVLGRRGDERVQVEVGVQEGKSRSCALPDGPPVPHGFTHRSHDPLDGELVTEAL